MKIKYEDLYDNKTLAYQKMKELKDISEYYKEQAQRADVLHSLLVEYISQGKITESEVLDDAISFYTFTDWSSEAIMYEIYGRLVDED